MTQVSETADFKTDSTAGKEQKFQEVMESRWRYAVFPAMVMFVLLIGFMFYLIYGMLQRMEDLSEDIDKMTNVISDSLPVMQGGVVSMSSRMQWVGDDLKQMTTDVNHMAQVLTENMPAMTRSIDGMTTDVSNMSYATNSMSQTTHNMGQNIWDMNRNISGGPFGMMRNMMPFSQKTAPPPQQYYNYSQPNNWYGQQPHMAVPVQQQSAPAAQAQNVASTEGLGSSKYAGYCASCHGIKGDGGVGPSLRNHASSAVVDVLEKYRVGELKGTMSGVAKEMTDHDIQVIADYVASAFKA